MEKDYEKDFKDLFGNQIKLGDKLLLIERYKDPTVICFSQIRYVHPSKVYREPRLVYFEEGYEKWKYELTVAETQCCTIVLDEFNLKKWRSKK